MREGAGRDVRPPDPRRPAVLDLSAAHPDVLVLVGTQTGNSEAVAEAVAERLGALGFAAHLLDMAEAVPEDLPGHRQLVAVTCTWSDGTFPDNAVDFVDALEAVRPDLSGVQFGVVGLGDRDYDPYYQTAAHRLAGLLRACSAAEAVPLWEIDGGPTPADVAGAEAWADGLAAAFAETA